MEVLTVVITNAADITNFPEITTSRDPLAMLEYYAHPPLLGSLEIQRVLELKDFINISITCKAMYTYMKNIRYGLFSVNALDYRVQESVFTHGSMFLYYELDLRLVQRFLELFKYTYIPWNDYDVKEYYGKWLGYSNDGYHGVTPLHIYCFYPKLSEIAIAIIRYDPKLLQELDGCKQTPLVVAIKYSYDVAKFIIENCDVCIGEFRYNNMTALEIAFCASNIRTTELLLPYGYHKDVITNLYLFYNKKEQLKFLMKHPECIDANFRNAWGYSIVEHLQIQLQSQRRGIKHREKIIALVHSLTSD
jgi:hypothetical protein